MFEDPDQQAEAAQQDRKDSELQKNQISSMNSFKKKKGSSVIQLGNLTQENDDVAGGINVMKFEGGKKDTSQNLSELEDQLEGILSS